MIRSAAVSRIQRLLGFRSDKATEIIDDLQTAQIELEAEGELPWFLLVEEVSIAVTSGDRTVAVPTGFIRQHEEGGLFLFDSTADEDEQWTQLEKATPETLRLAYQSGTGAPAAYTLVGSEFQIYPIPDDDYTLKLTKYYAKDDVLDTDIENEWLGKAHKLIIGVAGQKIAESLRDAGALQTFSSMEAEGRMELNTFQTAREEHGQVRQMGGKD